MLGRFKPVAFDPYGRRRSRQWVPRWLVLLLLGMLIGAIGVLVIQERYLPPRLTASASAELRSAIDQARADALRLKLELEDATKRLETTLGDRKGLDDELGAARDAAARLQAEVTSLIGLLPPDPRGGPIEVRAARFGVDGGALAYEVVLTRERAGAKPFSGVMQLVVAGDAGRGAPTTLALKPVPVSVGSYEALRGSLPLPDGVKPKQVTINVLDGPDGKRFGTRIIVVK